MLPSPDEASSPRVAATILKHAELLKTVPFVFPFIERVKVSNFN